MGEFTIEINFGGKFVNEPFKHYASGGVYHLDWVDPDTISLLDINKAVQKLEVSGDRLDYYYKVSGKELHHVDSVKPLETDSDLMDMLSYYKDGYVYFYVYLEGSSLQQDYVVRQLDDIGSNVDEVQDGGIGNGREGDNPIDNDSESECDSEYLAEDEMANDDYIYNGNVNFEVEWGGLRDEVPGEDPLDIGDLSKINHLDSDHGDSVDSSCSDYEYSSLDDEQSGKVKVPKFNPKIDMRSIMFKKGMLFSTPNEFRGALRDYAIRNGKEIRWIVNDGPKLRAGCVKGCDWEIYVTQMQNESTMQVKMLNDCHSCTRTYFNKFATSTWIAHKYLKDFRSNPKYPIKSLRDRVQEEWVVCPTKRQLYRARMVAREINEGCDREQYGRLWDYMQEIRRTNPGSTIVIETITSAKDEEVFQRLYIGLNALKNGMKEGCRHLIGLDGAHLRGTNTGQVLIAVGLDGNNQSNPFAYGIVEVENKDSWQWFMKHVREDLGIENSNHWTFISDKQKGLIPALEDDFPHSEHRFRVKHMYSNFMTENKGLLLKKLFYKAAKATTEPQFQKAMWVIKSTSKKAFEWLNQKNPSHWCRAFYRIECKIAEKINNNCESLNGAIKDAREKPILTLLESIRELLMDRLTQRRNAMAKWKGLLCPNIQAVIEDLKIKAGRCEPQESGGGWYEIKVTNSTRVGVNLDTKHCECRMWDLTGIPCFHAISAIYHRRHKPEQYVDDCYLISTYKKAYEGIIYPMNGPELWERTSAQPPLPPFYHKQPGRPKGARNLSTEEREAVTKKKRRSTCKGQKVQKCGNCGENNHNARTCKNPPNMDHQRKNLPRWKDKKAEERVRNAAKSFNATLPKNKGGRPRKRPYGDSFIPPPVARETTYAPLTYSGPSPSSTSISSHHPPTANTQASQASAPKRRYMTVNQLQTHAMERRERDRRSNV